MHQLKWPKSGAVLLISNEDKAIQYARACLCEDNVRSEDLLNANAHPDFQLIKPELNSQWIKIDQIRSLITWANGKPQIANRQIAIISPAHSMNMQAANALLKTLEESSQSILFILVSKRPSLIPVTIRSRCFWIRDRKNETILNSELKQSLKQDLKLIKIQRKDPVLTASDWLKNDPKEVVQGLLEVIYEEMCDSVNENQKHIKDRRRWVFFDKALSAKKALGEPNQPNVQLLFESLLIGYSHSYS